MIKPKAKTTKAKAKPKTNKAKRPPLPEMDLRDELLDAAMALAARKGWDAVSSEALAKAMQIDREDVVALMPDKTDILRWLAAKVNAAMHAPGAPESESARDALFELIMRRFDALAPYKAGVQAVAEAARADLFLPIVLAGDFATALGDTLELASLPSTPLHRAGLGALWLLVGNVWLNDDSVDLAATMAALDRRLGQLEEAAEALQSFLPSRPAAA